MAEDKEPSLMSLIFKKVLPYTNPKNAIEQVGNLYGVSEEDRNNSRFMKKYGDVPRPASHTATDVGAELTADALIPALAGAVKGVKSARAVNKAAKNDAAFDMLNDGIKNVDDYRVVQKLTDVGNELNRDGVNAVKSAKAGKVIKNSKRSAWHNNKNKAQTIIDNAKDAEKLSEVIDEAEPRRVEAFNKLADMADEAEDKLTPEEVMDFNKKLYEETYPNIVKSTFDEANKSIASRKGAKTAVVTGALTRALDRALPALHEMTGIPVIEYEPNYSKPSLFGSKEERLTRLGANFLLTSATPFGTRIDEWPTEKIDAVLNELNKDGYFDQKEIDSGTDVEKKWALDALKRGKFNTSKRNFSREVTDIVNRLYGTNNEEDKK